VFALTLLVIFNLYGAIIAARSTPVGFCPRKTPAASIGFAIGLGTLTIPSILYFLLGVGLLVAGIVSHGILAGISGGGGLLILGPVGFHAMMATRMDSRRRFRSLVYFNPIPATGTSFERRIENGETVDVSEPVVLYIPPDQWDELELSNPTIRQYFEGELRIAPGLYRAAGDNDFLHALDSLSLWRFIVHPGNPVAIKAFADALNGTAAAAVSVGDLYPESPAPSPGKPKRGRPRKETEKKHEGESESGIEPPVQFHDPNPATPAPAPAKPDDSPTPPPAAAAPTSETDEEETSKEPSGASEIPDPWEPEDVLPAPPASNGANRSTEPEESPTLRPALRRPSTKGLGSGKPKPTANRTPPPSEE
jgi:Uncharacterized membrane-bound protein